VTSLAEWLAADPVRVTEVLQRRPDVANGTPPKTIEELARRLELPGSIAVLAERLPRPHLQVMEAAQAMGWGASRSELSSLLARTDPEHDTLLSAVLDDLSDYAVLWPGTDGRLHVAAGVGDLWPFPLGLSYSARLLLQTLTIHELRQIAVCQGLRTPPSQRADLERAVAQRLSDPQWVRDRVAEASPEISAPIIELAQPDADDPQVLDDDELYYQMRRGGRGSAAFDAFLARQAAYQWAAGLGLLLGKQYAHDWQMPAEVALALRGDTYRAPFHPRRPAYLPLPADPRSVAAASASAATEFHQEALAVLDVVARQELPLAKSGGLAVRDLTRLAKTAVVEPMAARMTLELAAAAGLITTDTGVISTTRQFLRWRSEEAARRYAELLFAWWHLPYAPSQKETPDGKAIRALYQPLLEMNGDLARQAVISSLWGQPADEAVDFETFQTTLLWDRPILEYVSPPGTKPWAHAWAEAESLGLIAMGALTELGRAVPAAKPPELVPLISTLLPASSDSAIFGSDLTVMVLGSPTARVSRRLDGAAVRESRGAGITWRFSRDTVRGVLDAGISADELEAELASIATGELPQPLRYLIHDVGRRHGELRLSAALSVVRSDDIPRLAEAAVDRSLRSLGLRLVAPTVLTSQLPMDETMAALRKAGYFPMPEAPSSE
jgi:Helicase conserved C-terminal domain